MFFTLLKALLGGRYGSLQDWLPLHFESGSQSKRIEESVFERFSIKSMIVPRNVEVLDLHCFRECDSLLSISFESDSKLRRIGQRPFAQSLIQSMADPRNDDHSATHTPKHEPSR
jgi:hypothetical protein